MSKNLYRLVKPYQSDKVYESTTLMHGAGKCYKEIKKTNTNTTDFSIMDINSNQIYDFKISPSPKMELRKNPDELLNQNLNENFNQNGGTQNEIQELKNKMQEILMRIEKLEQKNII